uniref:Uncharacterized protein n=1 Tax=Meloidogyne enterolobii TaxID=390850 RepID=A0A6V7UNF0_MELEN|nr:unnamed protein product [Meloidogyne enterolobii]
MCFQCHMPIQCKSGFCFGDYCVKSIVANKYVSKGCENKTKIGGNYFEGEMKGGGYSTTTKFWGVFLCFCQIIRRRKRKSIN